MKVRVATGTAIHLGLRKGKLPSRPTTAHLLTPGKCTFDCAYCTKAKSSVSNPDFMCRITWPAHSEPHVWDALEETSTAFTRICIQVVNRQGCFETAKRWTREAKSRCNLPVSVEARVNRLSDVAELLRGGADCVGLPLDVASERLHPVLRGGRLDEALELTLSSADSFPGSISTHIIVGLGETDEEVVDVSRRVLEKDIPLALFAFTPCKGTRMENRDPPSLKRFRKIQLATHLIAEDSGMRFEYDRAGGLILPSIEEDNLISMMGKALLTRGCEGCNRPFYNERPGCTPYNYPETLTEEQMAEEIRVMRS
jgi:biotin synthase